MNVEVGDFARIVESVDGINVGKVVEVCSFQGVHSVFGPIWRVRSHEGELVTEYGAIGFSCDCADAWLQKLEPEDEPEPLVISIKRPVKEPA